MKKEVTGSVRQQPSPERVDQSTVAGSLPGWDSSKFSKNDWKQLTPEQKESLLKGLTENTSPNIIYRYLGAVTTAPGKIENISSAQERLFECAVAALQQVRTPEAVVNYIKLLNKFALADRSFAGGSEVRSSRIISSLSKAQIGALRENDEGMLTDLIKASRCEDSLRRELIRQSGPKGPESMEAVERFLGRENWGEYLSRMKLEAGVDYHDRQRDLERNTLALIKHCPQDALEKSVELLLTISGKSDDAKFRRGELILSLQSHQIESLSLNTLHKLAVNSDFPESRAVNPEQRKTLDAVVDRIEIPKIREKLLKAGSVHDKKL